MTPFMQELADLINKHSMENGSNTSDYILAKFLIGCLHSFDMAVTRRDEYYGYGQGDMIEDAEEPNSV